MNYTFKVEKREGKIKDDNLCMGVVSGPEIDSMPLQFDKKEFEKLYKEAGQNSIITLEGLGEPLEVTIHSLDRTSRKNEIHHVDFYALKRGAEMDADIPLNFVNEAPASKQDAIINQPVQSISITCRPRDLIQEIEVDMSQLKEIGDAIYVKDLNIPSAIEVNLDPDTVVASASEPKQEEPEETEEETEMPEVIGEAEGEGDSGEDSDSEEEKKEDAE